MARAPCLRIARDVLPVVEGQVAVGMRPYIVTPQGAGTAELYLSGENQDSRVLSLCCVVAGRAQLAEVIAGLRA